VFIISRATSAFIIAPTALVMTLSARADTLTGQASVIDGDTIQIHGERIRVLDVDAPESGQLCITKLGDLDKGAWSCGQQAALALSDWIGQQTITCEASKKDQHRRCLAHCSVTGQDIGEWLAANGWAVPNRNCKCNAVRDAAHAARGAQLGIWTSAFTLPWEWRKAH
jgi:endonuclease YncB( thermonuclease family)